MARQREREPVESASPATVHGSAGHVEVDARGNSVWRWRKQTPLDSTTIFLKRLDNDALALESSANRPQPDFDKAKAGPGKAKVDARKASAAPDRRHGPRQPVNSGGGFDPYNNT